MVDASRAETEPEELPAELEQRIRSIETHSAAADFDAVSWVWMVLLGILLPALLIMAGWVL